MLTKVSYGRFSVDPDRISVVLLTDFSVIFLADFVT